MKQDETSRIQQELVEAKKQIKKLERLSRVAKCLQLEAENLAFAQENTRLKELLEQNNILMR